MVHASSISVQGLFLKLFAGGAYFQRIHNFGLGKWLAPEYSPKPTIITDKNHFSGAAAGPARHGGVSIPRKTVF